MIEKLIKNSSKIEQKSKKGKPLSYKVNSEKNMTLSFKIHDKIFKEIQVFYGKSKVQSIWDSERITEIENLINDQILRQRKKEALNFVRA